MPHKRVLRPDRLRRVPAQFSWLDQRLVSERHCERCDVQALALYLVLVTVAETATPVKSALKLPRVALMLSGAMPANDDSRREQRKRDDVACTPPSGWG